MKKGVPNFQEVEIGMDGSARNGRPRRPESLPGNQFLVEYKAWLPEDKKKRTQPKTENLPPELLVGFLLSMSDSNVMLMIIDLPHLSIFPCFEYL